MRQKINKKAVVGRLVVGLFFVAQILAKKVEALVYDAGGDNDWCTADLQTNLNSTSSGFYSWFTSEQQGYFLATDDSCTNAKVSVPTAAVWNNAKEIYRQSVNGAASSDYLEATTESVWTRTAANTGTVYAITNDGLSSQETAVTSEIQTLPLVFLTTDLCAKTTVAADGSVAYPYMAEICDLTLGGNYFDLSSNTFCGSHIQTKLNQDGETTAYYNFFNYLEKKYLLSQDCSSPITLMTTTQWEAGKEAYRQALNGAASGNYLANGAATAWTQTAGTTGTAYAVASNGGAATETAIEMGEVEALPVVYFSEEAMTTGAGAGTLADPYVLATLSVAYDAGGDNNWCRSDLAEKLNSNSLGGFLADLGVLEAGYLNVSDWSANTVTPQETSCSAKVGAVSEDEWTEVKEVYQAAIEEDTGGSQSYAPAGVANFWTRTAATTVGYAETVVGSSGLVEETAVTTSANYAAVPAVYFDETTVCAIEATGAGTAADPYVLTTTACPLTLTIDNNSQDLIATIADGLTLSGTVTDERQAGEVVVQTTLSGVTKTTTVTAPVTAGAWSLSWTFEELQEGIYTGQAVEAASGASEGEATKSGEIIVDKTAPFCYPVQEATVSGTPSLILTDSAGVAKNYRIEGQSYQAVTPSPATPSAVVSLGEDAAVQVVSEGKNLFDISTAINGSIVSTTGQATETFNRCRTDFIYLKAGTYTISTVGTETDIIPGPAHEYSAADQSTWIQYISMNLTSTGTQNYRTFTAPRDNYYRFAFQPMTGSTITDLSVTTLPNYKPQIELGTTATAYQPYVEPTTTTIDLTGHEPLRCVGTGASKVCDYVDYGNQRIVRNVGKFIPRSNMGWGKSSWYQSRGWNAYDFKKSDINYIAYGTRMTSTHYGNNASGAENDAAVRDNTIMLSYTNYFYIVDNSLTTIEEFKNFIDNNDIEVYYQLATPTTEPITLPTLHTVEGDGTVTATDGNLTSSYMMVSFFQKADIPHWTPSAPVALKATPATQEFVLSDIFDAGGSGLAAASYSCTAAAENGASCSAQIADNAGNTTTCVSPVNRIGTADLALTLNEATRESIIVNNTDGLTLSGTVTDNNAGEQVTVSMTVAGVTKTTALDAPVTAGAWSFHWTFAELMETTVNGVTVTAADSAFDTLLTDDLQIIIDKTDPFCYPVQEATVSGTPKLTLTDSAGVAKNYRIEGQSYQAATPSPATPSAVVSLGGEVVVPEGYTQVEYLESSGTQWIDTGYIPNINTKMDINISDISTPDSLGNYAICGSRNVASAGSGFALMANKTSDGIKLRSDYFGDASYSSDYLSSNTIYGVVKDKNLFYIDGSLIATQPTSTNTANYNLYLFNLNNAGSITSSVITTIKIYSTKIYDNGTLVRNFIPAIRNSDSVAGMYDTVTGNFYTNSGTGSFVTGPVVEPAVQVVSEGKNLFDISTAINGSIVSTTGQATETFNRCRTDFIYLKAGTYTISTVGTATDIMPGQYAHEYSAADQSTWIQYISMNLTSTGTQNYRTFTAPRDNYYRFTFRPMVGSSITNLRITALPNYSPQIELGTTATAYQPYVEPTTTTIDLTGHEPLRCVGTRASKVCDYVDYGNGRIVRNIQKIEFDGTEHWTALPTAQTPYSYNLTNLAPSAGYYAGISSHLIVKGIYQTAQINGFQFLSFAGIIKRILISVGDLATTVADFKAWLASEYANGTPVTVYYKLATPTTEPIALPTLHTAEDDGTVTATDGNLTSNYMMVSFFQKADIPHWTPSAPVALKAAPATQEFVLSDIFDAGGSGLAAASYSCTAAAENGASCNAQIADNAGNTTTCVSPVNRIGTADLALTLNEATRESMIVNNTDGLTLSGTVTDNNAGEQVTVSMTVAGVTKTMALDAPITAGSWSLHWTFAELMETTVNGVTISAADSAFQTSLTDDLQIIIDKTDPFCYPVQEATVSGTPKLTLTDSAGVAKNYRIEGQSYQAVTPSPATPSAVVSLGEDAAVQVVSEGKNLLNIEEMFALDNVTYDELSSNEYFITASTDLFNVGFPLSTSEQIVLSAQIKKYDTRASGLRYRIYYTDDTYTESNTVFTITDNYQTVTAVSTLGKTVSKIGLAYSQTNEQFYVKNVMVEYGSTATAYQPYVAPQTTTIDLTGHEPLRCVGEGASKVCDYVDYGNGRIVRNVFAYTVDGTETWVFIQQGTTTNRFYFNPAILNIPAGMGNAKMNSVASNYFPRLPSGSYTQDVLACYTSGSMGLLGIRGDATVFSNAAAVKQWCLDRYNEGYPLILYYQLATPTIESISLPTLHTVEDDGTVTATDGNLTSNYMMVSFFQKADIPHWTPSAPVAWKTTAATQEFALSDVSDVGGSGLAAASYSCTAAAENGATCNAQVSDNAGNTAVCLSPANRIDTEAPVDGGIVYDGGLILEATASVQLVATDGADLVSGLDLTSRRLLRRFATLTEDAGNYTCENDWGEWLTTPYTGTYPDLMAAVRFGGSTCNQFAWSIADVAGNVAIFPGTNVIQVMANTAPTITIDNPTARLVATVTGGLQITGTVSDVDAGQTLRVSMTVGSEQAMSSASPQTAAPWRLKWTWAELVHGVYQNVPATVNDTISEATADYTGEIIVDKLLPTIRVTAPAAAVGENAQAIVVEATAGASGLQRIGFLWDQELNSVCTNGTAVLSGADIGGTQPDGQHTLHLCAVSNAGLVSFLNQTYNFNPLPIVPELERQVTGNNLWWNAKEIDPLSPSFTLSGLYQPTGQVYNYQLQLTIKDSNRAVALTKTLTVETSTTTITPFVFTILTSELNLSAQNNSFPGPMILTLTDLATNQVREVEWNLNLLAPIYQIDNLVNTGNYIRVYDSTISQIPSLQNFSASSCDSWQPVTGNDYSNAYGKKSDNPYLAAFSLRDERDGKIYEVRKLADGNCWIVTNMAYGECTANSFVDSETAASCRTNPVSNQYGYLYNYMAAQTVCPAGWHLPSGGASGEWAALQAAANELTFWQPGGGFAGLYSGQATSSEISGQGLNGLFWSQTSAATNGYCLKVDATTVDGVSELNKAVGVAARCIKD